jgi:hypothetical protein
VNNYSKEELAELEKWIQTHGAEKLHKIFSEKILKWRAASQSAFPRSAIGGLFRKLGVQLAEDRQKLPKTSYSNILNILSEF